MKLLTYLLTLVGVLLIGCRSSQSTAEVQLPLADNQPTFLLFYTDN